MRTLLVSVVFVLASCATGDSNIKYVQLDPSIPAYQNTPEDEPLVTASPEFPEYARRRGIQGYACVMIDIDSAGRMQNPRVYDSKPKGIFEENTIKAIKKWKFRATGELKADRRYCIQFELSS